MDGVASASGFPRNIFFYIFTEQVPSQSARQGLSLSIRCPDATGRRNIEAVHLVGSFSSSDHKRVECLHFEQQDGGVYIELEEVALSRDIPGQL